MFTSFLLCGQNVNSAQVELKQWLYRNGAEFPWNTGGWSYGKVALVHNAKWPGASGYATCELNANHVKFSGKAKSDTIYGAYDGYSGYYLSDCWSYMNIFANKPCLKNNISKYSSAVIDGERVSSIGSQTPRFVVRTGGPSNSETTIGTATITYNGPVDTGINTLGIQGISTGNDNYFVFGMTLGANGHEGWQINTGSFSYEHTYKLYSLYLV